MQLSHQRRFALPQQQVWAGLNDTALLQAAIPGCDSLTAAGEHRYEARMSAAVGPLKAHFSGTLQLQRLQPPESYDLHFQAQGSTGGSAQGVAHVRLEAVGEHETLLHYSASAELEGKVAQIGSRLVGLAARHIADEFFSNFTEALMRRHAPDAVSPSLDGDAAAEGPDGKGRRGLLRKLFARRPAAADTGEAPAPDAKAAAHRDGDA